MILENETLANIGKTPEQANQRDKITCKCDYCGTVFERTKANLQRSHQNLKNDSCSDPKCVQQKRVDVSRLKFGTDNPFQNEEVKAKIKAKVDPQREEIMAKIEKTVLEIYGVKNVFANKGIQDKISKTISDTYGVSNVFQNKDVQAKQKKTVEERYGVKHYSHTTEYKDKVIKTCLERYGKYPAGNGLYGKTQKELQDWLNSFGFNFGPNHQLLGNGQEIDMYDASKKLAIEYCGLYWHNECSPEPRNQNYHYNKYKKCLYQGIQLLTIFSDEWDTRQFQCKSHLKSLLGVIDRRLYARKCTISELDRADARKFFQDYHIQGKNNLGIVYFGLLFENEVVGVMSLGRHNRQYSNALVLDRLCFKDGVQVIGGASKLLKHCVEWAKQQKHESIISFSDNRWSVGKVYEALKFKMEHEYRPDYSYVEVERPDSRLSKQSQKKSTVDCPPELTEYEWAKQRGLARIWDCGKKRWIYTLV